LAIVHPIVHGKLGGRASPMEGRDSDRVVSPQAVGKRTLVEALAAREPHGSPPVQRNASGEPPLEGAAPVNIARHGTEGSGSRLPHYDSIQACSSGGTACDVNCPPTQ
jgi:hypothetical protein